MYVEATLHGANRVNFQADYPEAEFQNLVISEDEFAEAMDRFVRGLAGVDERASKRADRAQARNRVVDAHEDQARDELPDGDSSVGEDGDRRAETSLPKTDALKADAEANQTAKKSGERTARTRTRT